ncbi:TraK family protein [Vreelandella aquamarina]|uniref:TraK family protein n=1 Tax=Vreelandella aquamarina TaxID=77097 RepID=UPI00384F6B66
MGLIEELHAAKKKSPMGNGKINFFKYMHEIEEALNQGYTAMDIWTLLHNKGELQIKYNQFSVYVRKYIKEKNDE